MAYVNQKTKPNTAFVIGRYGQPRSSRFTSLIDEIQQDSANTRVSIVVSDVDTKLQVYEYLMENLKDIQKNHNARRWIETDKHRIDIRMVYDRASFRGAPAETQKFIILESELHHDFHDSFFKCLAKSGNDHATCGTDDDLG